MKLSRSKSLLSVVLLLAVFIATLPSSGAKAGALQDIQSRGVLKCGVSEGLKGFSYRDETDTWSGFDVEFCRALAVAVLADASKVVFIPLSAEKRFQSLKTSEIDVLSRNTTWTMSRDIELGLTFPAITYYDGQGFMLPESLGISSVAHLSGAKVCVVSDTTAQSNIVSHFAGQGMGQSVLPFDQHNTALEHYESGDCDTFSADRSALFADRLSLKDPSKHMILPDVISKEPLGPVIRDGDENWADIVRWTVAVLVNSEELKLTRKLVSDPQASLDSQQKQFLDRANTLGALLGLTQKWARDVVATVGHYGEIFERNLGAESELGILRGANALWNRGGLIYAPPIQ